jgi:hypothetical protein
MMASTRKCAHLFVIFHVKGRIAVERDHGRGTNRDGIRAQRQRLSRIDAALDAATHDKLHFAAEVEVFQRARRFADSAQRRNPGVIEQHIWAGCRAAFHAIDHDAIGAGFGRQLHIFINARRTELDVNRLCQSVASRSSSILMARSSGPIQSGWRHGLR